MDENLHDHRHPRHIADTKVTWASLQDNLQRILMTGSRCRLTSTVRKMEGTVGFLSQVYLCDLHWYPEVPKLPQQVVLKVPVSNSPKVEEDVESHTDVELLLLSMFRAERAFYEFYRMHEHDSTSWPPLPHFYYAAHFQGNQDYLVFEYLKGTHSLHIWDNFSEAQIDAILRSIAKIQACGILKQSSTTSGLFMNMFNVLYKKCWSLQNLLDLLKKTPGFFGEDLKPLCDAVEAKARDIFDTHISEKTCRKLGIGQVLLHGDLWSTNVLWDNVHRDKLRALIDFQMVHHGSPAEDLVRFLNSCLSGSERRKNWQKHLATFYNYLKTELKGHEMPYTYSQLIDAFVLFYPMEALVYIPPLVPIVSGALQNCDEDVRNARKSVVAEKVRCMLEDILEFRK